MINLEFIRTKLFAKKPAIPNVMVEQAEKLYPDGLTMGTLFIGRQGSGKTSSLARHLVEYFKAFPERAIFVLDWSGSITDNILKLILQEPEVVRDRLVKRLVYDAMGHTEWVIPLPEFSSEYGLYEEQVQRVSRNLTRLAPELIKGAPFLGGLSLQEIAPEIFRLLTAITNEIGECWQITEAKKLLRDESILRRALIIFGHKVPHAKWWLERVYLEIKESERELRSYALLALLGVIEPIEVRARLGYYRPGWTAREAIEKGLMVLCDGARLINQEMTQHYLFMQAYSLIMAEINKRRPANPEDLPVSLVMDEVYSLIQIPGMAPEISKLSPQYRSRKLQMYIVLQELAQMSAELRPHIWSLGNIVCFALTNFNEAFELSQQLFKYEPQVVKIPPRTEIQQPILEPDRGQYLAIANYIQRMKHRECILRRYLSEKMMDRYVRMVPRTKENYMVRTEDQIKDLKERLLKERGVRLRDALEVIHKRDIPFEDLKALSKKPPQI